MKCRFGINLMNVLSRSIFMFPQEDTKGAVGGIQEGGKVTALMNC